MSDYIAGQLHRQRTRTLREASLSHVGQQRPGRSDEIDSGAPPHTFLE